MLDECTKAMLDHTILRNEGIGTWGKKKKKPEHLKLKKKGMGVKRWGNLSGRETTRESKETRFV